MFFGGLVSVYVDGVLKFDLVLLDFGVLVFGICYGF